MLTGKLGVTIGKAALAGTDAGAVGELTGGNASARVEGAMVGCGWVGHAANGSQTLTRSPPGVWTSGRTKRSSSASNAATTQSAPCGWSTSTNIAWAFTPNGSNARQSRSASSMSNHRSSRMGMSVDALRDGSPSSMLRHKKVNPLRETPQTHPCDLTIYQFYVIQRGGSGVAACMSLAIRRRPRVNQETLERATLAGWRVKCFFRRGWGGELRPIALSRRRYRERAPSPRAGEPVCQDNAAACCQCQSRVT